MLQRKAFQGIAPQHCPNRAPSARCPVAKASASHSKAALQRAVVLETQSGTVALFPQDPARAVAPNGRPDTQCLLADLTLGRREAVGLALAAAFAGESLSSQPAYSLEMAHGALARTCQAEKHIDRLLDSWDMHAQLAPSRQCAGVDAVQGSCPLLMWQKPSPATLLNSRRCAADQH